MKIGLVGLSLLVMVLATDRLLLHINVTFFFAEAPQNFPSAVTRLMAMKRAGNIQADDASHRGVEKGPAQKLSVSNRRPSFLPLFYPPAAHQVPRPPGPAPPANPRPIIPSHC